MIKQTGQKQVFDREKLVRSMRIATRKRSVDDERIELAINGIVRQLESRGDGDVFAVDIGELVMDALHGIDNIAYIRYASVYKSFEEAKDFKDFIDNKK